MKRSYLLAALCMLFTFTAISRPSSPNNALLRELRKAERVESERIGITAVRSEVYIIAKMLWERSSVEELVQLTADRSPIVRCYAFLGLIRKNCPKTLLQEIIQKHSRDTVRISTMNGCIVWNGFTVLEYMKMQLIDDL